MPVANCSRFGCRTSQKHVGVRIFRVPAETDDSSKKTRQARIHVITKDRVVDKSLLRQINTGMLYVSKKHFNEDKIISGKYFFLLLDIAN